MLGIKVRGKGPAPARIMIVGEAPGAEEETQRQPFVGASGKELNKMLEQAGLLSYSIYYTNVSKYRPLNNDIERFLPKKREGLARGLPWHRGRHCSPEIIEGMEELAVEILAVRPDIILALGDTALWALTGETGISRWRGSYLESLPISRQGREYRFRVIPTYHPAAILRMWSWRLTAITDMKRITDALTTEWPKPPFEQFIIRPPVDAALSYMTACREQFEPIAIDIETRGGYMTCVGIARNTQVAMCIPFVNEDGTPYWSLDEERIVRSRLAEMLTQANFIIMQNGIYDCQYFIRELGVCPTVTFDTMLAQHVLLPGTPKSLDFLASLYCHYYRYWKQESKEWVKGMPIEQLWAYNCKDCVYTYEVYQKQTQQLTQASLYDQFNLLMELYPPVLSAMTLGIRQDLKGLAEESQDLSDEMAEDKRRLSVIFGHPVNPRSPAQLSKLFYKDFKIAPIRNRKTGQTTLNEAALTEIKNRPGTLHELLELPIELILRFRQNSVLKSTFVEARVAEDKRFHTSFNIGGTETFRFSSSSNAFNEGTNGQNIPPRMRKYLLPDEGYELEDWDFEQADARVVAWDSNCARLKEIFSDPKRSIHVENCRDLFPDRVKGWSDEAIKATQVASNHYERYYFLAKTGCHAVNYFVQARTLAKTLGVTVKEAEKFIQTWLGLNPEIQGWHKEIEHLVSTTRTVYNVFGFRRIYLDRIDVPVIQQALAWKGQSTVAIAILHAMLNIHNHLADQVDLLLQVHDSLLLQVPLNSKLASTREAIKEAMTITIPYFPDPLIIPVQMGASEKSWGDCKG